MKKTLLIIASAVVLFQSCRKDQNSPSPSTPKGGTSSTDGAIAESSGLTLNAVGDFGLFQCLNDAGDNAGIPGFTKNNNDTIGLAAYEGTAYQRWKITYLGNGGYSIMNTGSGKYVEAGSNGQIFQDAQNTSDSQVWNLVRLTDKSYKAISKSTGLAVTAMGSGIRLSAYTGAQTQIWGYNQLASNDAVATAFTVTGLMQNDMVVQRDKPFQIWGTTNAGAKVNVKASWNADVITATADGTGKWSMFIPASGANNQAQTLTCSANGPQPVKFTGVLIGDVWVCSGQSNMVMPLIKLDDNFGGMHGVFNYQFEIAAANYPHIRMLVIRGATSSSPQAELSNPGKWVVCNPTNAAATNFSATAYYFAQKLQTSIPGDVPIGVVVSAFSATSIAQWSSPAAIAADPLTQSYYGGNSSNSQLYNAMIYSLKNLSIKGFIWYQGENNTSDSPVSNYTILNRNMIKDWRTLFNQGTLPFYYVQLPPLGTLFADSSAYKNALFREAQSNVRTLEKTGMACLMDVNEVFNIHNIYKKPVGERLGLLALANDYGQKVVSVGPQYVNYTQNGDVVTVNFKNADGLTDNGKQQPQYFYVASATDKKLLRATNVVISGSTVTFKVPVSGMKVDAIRYAFTETAVTHINNGGGLPMEPFRTDNW